jgi:biopolymer transport protein ExbD
VATWDVFHSDRLEVERSLSTAAVRAALARGELHDDDLARPAGTNTPWARLTDLPDLIRAEPTADDEPALIERETDEIPSMRLLAEEVGGEPVADALIDDDEPIADALIDDDESLEAEALDVDEDEDEDQDEDDDEQPWRPAAQAPKAQAPEPPPRRDDPYEASEFNIDLERPARHINLPEEGQEELAWDAEPAEEEEFDPLDEDEEVAEFSLTRSGPQKIEELDLAAMVDVAFQMVLFFMVTATTILYKTLEVPKTPPESAPGAVAQGQQRKSLDDLKNDFILVEIDPQGVIKIDHEQANPDSLVERLRKARKETDRRSMLLSADFATPHRNAVLAYDAANEIGLSIAIAKPVGPGGGGGGGPPPPPASKKEASG